MIARDAISRIRKTGADMPVRTVGEDTNLLDVLPRLLDAPGRELLVEGRDGAVGVIDQTSLLEALGRMIAARPDCSVIELECAPADYSASHIARAVEDADVHLVDLITSPGDEGKLRVTLRVRCEDPEPVAHSLGRYGYEVVRMSGSGEVDRTVAFERLLALQTLINV
ncbi:MAG: hypothetical protein K2L59_02670 [Muribaculaceae bacterium]|nr:hypothetical protein [Muribaculaceae bacterium]